MTPLLRFVVDSKPTGLKKRAELGIVTAEIPKNRAVGEDKAHEGRVSLEELRAINWENINWSEFRDAISQDPGVGSSGFRRSIAQEVTNGFSGCSQRKIRFSGEHRRQLKDSGDQDKQKRGTVSLARSKDALDTKRGEATLDAPEGGEKERRKMTIWS